jgi:hypothetical protein
LEFDSIGRSIDDLVVKGKITRNRPMETFNKLFGSLLAFVYHCFDRIVIQGYLPLLTREEHIVHFFRDVLGLYPITQDVLSRRTTEYKHWVEAFARNHKIPMEWAQKGVRKEDYVRPHLQRMQRRNRWGVYFILQSMEQGVSFHSPIRSMPMKIPTIALSASGLYDSLISTSTSAMKCSAPW